MGDILIRDVDDAIVRRLKSKAEVNGTSLQAEARKALVYGSPLSAEERYKVFAELDRAWGGEGQRQVEGAELVREVREEGEC